MQNSNELEYVFVYMLLKFLFLSLKCIFYVVVVFLDFVGVFCCLDFVVFVCVALPSFLTLF